MTVNHDDERQRLLEELIPARILKEYESMRFLRAWPSTMLWPIVFKLGHSRRIYNFFLGIKRLLGYDINGDELKHLGKLK